MEFWAQIRPNNRGDLMSYWSQTCFGHVLEFGIWQLKQEFCRLKHALEQEIYLLRGCRNFIVEIDVKYLVGMLSNLAKMFNMTINY